MNTHTREVAVTATLNRGTWVARGCGKTATSTESHSSAIKRLAEKLGMRNNPIFTNVHACIDGSVYGRLQEIHSPNLDKLAHAIADGAVRSDIELYAHGFNDPDGSPRYDISRGQDEPRDILVTQRAVQYIEARGDVFPWRLRRSSDAPHIVWFEDKAVQS